MTTYPKGSEVYCECPKCNHMVPEEDLHEHLWECLGIRKLLSDAMKTYVKWARCVKDVKNQHRGRLKVAQKKPFAQVVNK